ncbi:hypothetical protein, partial [Treponema sp.]|uniref:hypothetical protein n=1 Tax=Treponema sp. TaxID=166 RepID=UPI00388FD242
SKTINGITYISTSYEYATRTVLKFILDGSNKYDQNHYNDSVTVSDGTYNMCQLQIWVQGGDSASGTNTISTFPLSWGKESYTENGVTSEKFNYKLMHAYSNNKKANWTGTWAWVTWDLSSAAYHGFVAGDVPSDALQNGPKVCFAGECAWNALKGNYILYPGETLQMCLTSDTDIADKGAYFFRTKNKLER